MDAKRVIEEALRLPVDARAALAGELLASLDGSEVDPGREAAWADEIRHRIDAWEQGEMKSITSTDFLSHTASADRAIGEVVSPVRLPCAVQSLRRSVAAASPIQREGAISTTPPPTVKCTR